MQGEKGSSEAGGEGGGGLRDPALGARHLGGVPREEVVHGLFRGQPGDGGEDPEGVRGEEDDGPGVSRHPGRHMIGNGLQHVARPSVLGDALGVVIDGPGFGIEVHVLEDGPEHPGGGVDLGLGIRSEADHLGVAAALEVEDAAVTPAMLVVADEPARRVRRECGLPGAGQPEEHRTVPLGADIGGAVHGEDILHREEIVEHGEDGLLQLSRISSSSDENHPPAEVEDDEGSRPGAMPGRVGLKLGGVEDGVFGLEIGEFRGIGPDEHVPDEEGLPGPGGDESHRHPVVGVGSSEEILDVHRLPRQMGLHVLQEHVKRFLGDPCVAVPPDPVPRPRLVHHELVPGRPSGVRRGQGGQGSLVGESDLLVPDGVLHQGGPPEVGMGRDRGEAGENRVGGGSLRRHAESIGAGAPVWVKRLRRTPLGATAEQEP